MEDDIPVVLHHLSGLVSGNLPGLAGGNLRGLDGEDDTVWQMLRKVRCGLSEWGREGHRAG